MTSVLPEVALGDVIELIMGQAPSSKDCNFDGKGTPFVKVGEFGELRPQIREWTTNPIRLARRSDVLLCVVGATCGKINLGEDCAIGRSVAAIRPDSNRLDQMYLYYFMMTLVMRLRSRSKGAAQTVISKAMIESIPVRLPTLTEQRRIVAILDQAFEAIQHAGLNAERGIVLSKDLLDTYVEEKLLSSDDQWTTRRLQDVCTLARGGSPRPIEAYLTDKEDGINWIKISDATASGKYIETTAQKIKPEGVKRSRLVKRGDLLLSNSMSFGRPYVMATDGCIHDGWLVLSNYERYLDQDFLYRMLGSRWLYKQFEEKAAGTTVRNLNIDRVKSVTVRFPPLALQRELVKQIDRVAQEVERYCAILHRKREATDNLRESALAKFFDN